MSLAVTVKLIALDTATLLRVQGAPLYSTVEAVAASLCLIEAWPGLAHRLTTALNATRSSEPGPTPLNSKPSQPTKGPDQVAVQ